MSMIQDVRHRTNEFNRLYNREEGEEEQNAYWQGYMNDSGVEEMKTYDFAIQDAENFFYNLDCYEDARFLSEDQAERLRSCFLNWMESKRDEYGVSIIESMDADEYEEIKRQVDAGERHNYCTDMKDEESEKE